jgi:hypothetical protein
MSSATSVYQPSGLDGAEAGCFVVVNVDSPHDRSTGAMVCDTPESTNVFASLDEARSFANAARDESGNDNIFVYALVGVGDAVAAWPDSFGLR